MLVSDDQRLLLARSLAPSQGRVSRLFVDEISAEPRLGESIDITLHEGEPVPVLEVTLGAENRCNMPLHLTRYEFLIRVAEGALPGSFSRECYEDLLAFKSQLLKAAGKLEEHDGTPRPTISPFPCYSWKVQAALYHAGLNSEGPERHGKRTSKAREHNSPDEPPDGPAAGKPAAADYVPLTAGVWPGALSGLPFSAPPDGLHPNRDRSINAVAR